MEAVHLVLVPNVAWLVDGCCSVLSFGALAQPGFKPTSTGAKPLLDLSMASDVALSKERV